MEIQWINIEMGSLGWDRGKRPQIPPPHSPPFAPLNPPRPYSLHTLEQNLKPSSGLWD